MRSKKKMPYVAYHLLKKLFAAISSGSRKAMNTYSRRSTVIPEMVGMNLSVYNGKKFIPVFITENMVGHKLGEFSPTRKVPTRKSDSSVKK